MIKLHNFSDKVLNNLISIAKLKEKTSINRGKARELNLPIKDIKLKLYNYKKINILYDDLINYVWSMIFNKNRVNNEMDNIEFDIVEDARTSLHKYINIVSDKQSLIYSVSESIDELMDGLDVNSSNDTATKEIKDYKRYVIKSIDKFNSYIKQEKILKKKILTEKILKRKIPKRKIPQKNISKR